MYSSLDDVLEDGSSDNEPILRPISERREEEEQYNADGESISYQSALSIRSSNEESGGSSDSEESGESDESSESEENYSSEVPPPSKKRVANPPTRGVDPSSAEDDAYVNTSVDDSNMSIESEASLMCCTPSPLMLGFLCCLVLVFSGALAAGIVVGIDRRNDNKSNNNQITPSDNNDRGIPTAAPIEMIPTAAPETQAPATATSPPVALPTSSPTTAGTTAPPDPRLEPFSDLVGPAVYRTGTPQHAAADWILNRDPALTEGRMLQDDAEEPINVQRFLMAFWYYATSSVATLPWRSCNPATNNTSACQFSMLVGVDADTNDFVFEQGTGIRWLSAEHECEWMGAECDVNLNVTGLNLAAQILTGTLVADIMQLPSLTKLELGYNELTGRLSPGFGRLEYFNVQHNNMIGAVTNEFFDSAESMRVLNLGSNSFSGSDFPWSKAVNLEILDISSNMFNGDLPTSEISQLTALKEFKVRNNQFQGRLPTDWGTQNSTLEVVWLSQNNLVGDIPDSIGEISGLTDLRLDNCMFTSKIPDGIYRLVNLKKLTLHGNRLLSGPISSAIGDLQELEELDLSGNIFTGTIPAALSNLPKLVKLDVSLNAFSGAVPNQLCNFGPTELRWDVLRADCSPTEAPPNDCPCCTQCCSREDGECANNRPESSFRAYFVETVGEQVNDVGSPADQALMWLINEDPMELTLGAPNLLQRFLMVLFYFHTTVDGLWTTCNPPTAGESNECVFPEPMETLSDTLEDKDSFRWLSGQFECRWAGVFCGERDGTIVTGLSLGANGLSNTIPEELAMFPSFKHFSVPHNAITGTLPEFFRDIPSITHLEVRGNALNGTIFGRFFTGVSQFVTFDVSENEISGNFPNAVGRQSDLRTLHVNSNKFSGTITESLTRLPNLESLQLGGNAFTPAIPPTIFPQIPQLKVLSLKAGGFTGPIPAELYNMPNLLSLDLSENSLTGTLAPAVATMSSLQRLVLNSNNFTGAIPSEIGTMSNLQVISFAFNNFTDSVPSDLCGLPMDPRLVADCAGLSAISCSCCTACCDPAVDLCFAI